MTNEEAIVVLKNKSCYECSFGCNSAFTCECEACEYKSASIAAIEALKAQKLGEWVKFKDENGYTKFMCSNCRFTRGRDKPKYCPNCGSNNRGCKE